MNFGGTGLNLTALDNSIAHFDFSGSGFATKTGWITAGEGLLIKDNGLGGSTITPDELLGAQSGSGFDDLAALDSNADGVINASDADFGQLKVWVDQNLDGVLNTGELKSMSDVGITSISLSRTPVGQTINGNQVVEQASITINGVEKVIAEVDFATSTIDTIYLPPDGFTYAQAALKLPQLAGYGTLANLHVSMSQNATLLTDVQNFVLNAGTMTGAAFDAGFEALLLEWAGVSSVDPASRGPYVNAQHLAFVYAFYGIDPVSQTAYAVDPNTLRGPQWEDLYRYLVDQLEVRFASQVGLGLFLNGSNLVDLESNPLTVFSEIGFNPSTDTITVDLGHLLKSIVQHAPDDPTEAQGYYDLMFRIVRGLRVDLYNEDTATFTAVVLTKLSALGVSDALEKTVASAFGFATVLDEGSATGAISLSSTNGVVFVGDGDKTLSGGSGNIYIYSASGGNDSISDLSGKAELVLKDLSASEVILHRPDNGADLVIVNAGSGATLTLHDYFSNGTFKGIALAGGGFLTLDGVNQTLRHEAIAYLASASEGTDSPAQRVAKLASFGFMSVVDEGTTTGNVGATNNVDIVLIGTGDKTVAGGGNADIYVYSANGGNVTVDDSVNPGGTSDLVLSDINSTGVTLSRPGGGANLVLTVTATGKTVTVASEFFWFGTGSLKTITFADGVSWTTQQIKQLMLSQESAAASGSVYGYYGNDTLIAGPGDKYLQGQGGIDTYIYSSSGGNDIVDDAGHAVSTLRFSDIASTGITLSRPGGAANLVITVTATGKTVTVNGEFFWTGQGALNTIRFADGVSWTTPQVKQMLLDQESAASTGSVYGYFGDDILIAGPGDKYLQGQGGTDTYIYSSSGGNDIIADEGHSFSTLQFSDIASTGVTLSRPGGAENLVITVAATGKTVTVNQEFFWTGQGALQSITFSDGVSWTTPQIKQMLLNQESAASAGSVYGYYGDDTLIAGPGDKYLDGQGGTDTYVYSSSGGNDVIVDEGHSVSTLQFSDIASTGVTLSRPGGASNLVITVTATGKTVTVNGEFFWTGQGALNAITFADGVSWTTQQVKQLVLDQESAATGGAVYGYNGDDTLVAGPGDKYLQGQGGNNTYVYSSAGGNDVVDDEGHGISTLQFSDIASTGVTLSRPGGAANLVITVTATGKTVTVNNEFFWTGQGALNTITFADGVSWTIQQVKQLLLDQESAATGGSVYGYNGDDTLVAGPGDKYLQGQGGANTYVYSSAGGNDVVDDEGHAVSTLQFSDIASTGVTLSRPGGGNDLVITVIATGKTVTVDNEFYWSGQGSLSAITFSDGVSWNKSQIEDILNGGNGAPVLKNFGRGDGQITLDDGTSVVQMGAGIDQSDILLQASGSDLIVRLVGTSDSITVHGDLAAHAWGVSSILQQLKFSDGSVLDIGEPAAGQGQPISFTWLGTSSYSTLYGSTYGSNIFEISASNISVQFADAASVGGSNKIEYNSGSGQSDVYLNGATGSIELEAGISASDVLLQSSGSDLILRVGTGSDAITVHGDLSGGTDGLHSVLGEIAFSDGTVWDRTYIESNAWIRGTSGGDALYGNSYADVLDGKGGNDYLHGGGGGDIYIYGVGSGNDTVSESSGDSGTDVVKLAGLNASDVTFSRSGNDLFVQINATSEALKVENQFNGTNGIEQVTFADGATWDRSQIADAAWVRGSSGNDMLFGSSDAEVFDGKGGNDYLHGGGGGDTYLFGAGSGNDTVAESSGDSGDDIVKLAGLNSSDVLFSRSGNDLLIQINSSGETLKVENQFTGTNGIEQVTFANGSTWDRTAIFNAAWVLGTSGNDTLFGSSDAEVFDGRGGNDYLHGGGGGDTYLLGVGSGNDIVAESSGDTGDDVVKLAGLNSSDVLFSRSGNDLLIQINSSGETLKVENQFTGTNGIEQVTFANGSTWDRAAIFNAAWVLGTSGNDTLFGSSDAEVFDGKGGNDYLHGGGGGDTYLLGAGSGNDIVAESSGDTGDDVVKLSGLNSSDVLFNRSGNDLLIQINSSGETLKVENQFNGTNGIEQVVFADGSTWDRAAIFNAAWVLGTSGNDTLFGSSDAEVFDGKGGNDYLRGGGGGDTYLFGVDSGNDTVSEFSGDTGDDIIKLVDLTSSDVVFSHSGNDLLIEINATGETLRVENQFNGSNGIEEIVFADGTTWDRTQIDAASWFRGTAGNNSISASSSDDVLFGGLGNDYLRGNDGADTYIYTSGHGNDQIDDESGSTTQIDTLKFTDLNQGDLTISRVGGDLVVGVNSTGETIKVDYQFYSLTGNWGIEKIEFANGDSLDLATINSSAWYRGTSGNDSITGSSWDETFLGNQGNDYLRGNDGADTYVYASGHGNDEIDDQSSSTTQIDTLKLTDLNPGDLTLSRVGDHLMIGIDSTGATIKVDYQFYSQTANWGIEKIEFANNTSWDIAAINTNAWIRGTGGNDTISGTSWSDTIAGGAGNDALSGGSGDDTFVFRAGLGQDTVTDFTAGHDVLEFRDGIFADAAAALAAASTSGSDTIITIDATTSVLLQNVALANLHAGDFHIV